MKAIKIFMAVLAASMVMSCGTTPKETVNGVELPSSAQIDTVSYLLGVNFGSMIKGNDFAQSVDEINMNELKKGIIDFLNAEGQPMDPEFGKQFKINPDLINMLFNNYIQARQDYKAALNKAKEDEFMAENAKKEGVQTTESGLQYKLVSAGADYKVQPQDTVWVSYKGTLLDGTVFDEVPADQDPISLSLDSVIPAWTEGIQLVGEGGSIVLYVPSELGYGERGAGPIPGGSTLIFEVTVHEVKPKAE